MNISEANAVNTLLDALTLRRAVDADRVVEAATFLGDRADKALHAGAPVPEDSIRRVVSCSHVGAR